MFNFGTAEDNANLFLEGALSARGPLLPDVHADEMSVQDLRNALAYARMAYEAALEAGAGDDTLDVLLARHDAVFEALAAVDDTFKGRVLGTVPGRIIWLGGYSEDNIAKYKLLASGVSLEELSAN